MTRSRRRSQSQGNRDGFHGQAPEIPSVTRLKQAAGIDPLEQGPLIDAFTQFWRSPTVMGQLDDSDSKSLTHFVSLAGLETVAEPQARLRPQPPKRPATHSHSVASSLVSAIVEETVAARGAVLPQPAPAATTSATKSSFSLMPTGASYSATG